jgi:hypothetical protein
MHKGTGLSKILNLGQTFWFNLYLVSAGKMLCFQSIRRRYVMRVTRYFKMKKKEFVFEARYKCNMLHNVH